MRRSVLALVTVVLTAVTDCGAGRPGADAPPGSNPLDSQVLVPPTDPADLLFQITAFAAPTVTVYRDGTVVRQAPHNGPGVRPPQFLTGRAEPDLLVAFVTELEAWHRPVDDKAFGIPNVTDLTSTRVVVHTPETTATLDIYNFQPSLDRYMSDAARANRAALRRLVDHAAAPMSGAEPYVPAVVRAIDVGPAGQDSGARDWPGPSLDHFESGRFLGFRCLVSDESAADLYRTAVVNKSAV